MKLLLYSILLVLCLRSGHCRDEGGVLLYRSLDALTRALHFVKGQVSKINLDAVVAVRIVEEQLRAFLIFEPEVFLNIRRWLEVLRDKAKHIADTGLDIFYKKNHNFPDAAKYGFLMAESKKLLWYPNRNTSVEFTEEAVPCNREYFNLTMSDLCYSEISGGRGNISRCGVTSACIKHKTERNQRGYALTHQILYWLLMEMRKCVDSIPEKLQFELCSNVMRDVNRTTRAHYPKTHEDLFMEQIAFCGFWGFSDFNKAEWLEKILELQSPSGCYANFGMYRCFDESEPSTHVTAQREGSVTPDQLGATHSRAERGEVFLSDGCLAHKTAVAVMALVVNIRFEAEKAYKEMDKNENSLNKLLR